MIMEMLVLLMDLLLAQMYQQMPKVYDTVYSHPTSAGNKHIPTGGASGQVLKLKYLLSGTAHGKLMEPIQIKKMVKVIL